jgi:hypothetical protein
VHVGGVRAPVGSPGLRVVDVRVYEAWDDPLAVASITGTTSPISHFPTDVGTPLASLDAR